MEVDAWQRRCEELETEIGGKKQLSESEYGRLCEEIRSYELEVDNLRRRLEEKEEEYYERESRDYDRQTIVQTEMDRMALLV